jgi:hypothetical protein
MSENGCHSAPTVGPFVGLGQLAPPMPRSNVAQPRRDNDMASSPRDVVVLVSTGPVGTQALNVVRRNLGRFRVVAWPRAAGRGRCAMCV